MLVPLHKGGTVTASTRGRRANYYVNDVPENGTCQENIEASSADIPDSRFYPRYSLKPIKVPVIGVKHI